jgi:glycine rich protein
VRGLPRASENESGQRARRSLAAVLVCAVALPLAFAATPAQAITKTFAFTEGEQAFLVPAGVHRVHVVAVAGRGGNATDALGGQAGEAIGDIAVNPGQTLYVEVGGDGESQADGGEGGFNGGGDGAGGGGGASDVRTLPASAPSSLESRLIVAPGGGGGGATGESAGTNGGAGGSPGVSGSYPGGGAGTSTEGGEGAEGCEASGFGTDGQLGLGGDGGASFVATGPGGGGGGGYYGGGGGGGACFVESSGGGGGSFLIPPGGIEGNTSDAAFVQISYNPPPSISIATPTNGATYTQGQSVAASYSCSAPAKTSVKSCIGSVGNGAPIDTATVGQHSFTVSAEDADAGTATQTVSYVVVPQKVPATTLGSHPKKKIKTKKKKVKVKFTFSSSEPGSTFECKLDKGAYAPCTSPKTYKVKLGSHVFTVRAKLAGVVDPTPATFKFKVKKKA